MRIMLPARARPTAALTGPTTSPDTESPKASEKIKHQGLDYTSPTLAPKRADGFRPHKWSSDWSSDGSSTCSVCGLSSYPNTIDVDKIGQGTRYVDAHRVEIYLKDEPSCPTYIGSLGGATWTTKEKVQKVEGRVESVEERLDRLEAENEAMRMAMAQRPIVDAEVLVGILRQIADLARQQSPRGLLETERVIIDIGEFEIVERELVFATEETEDG